MAKDKSKYKSKHKSIIQKFTETMKGLTDSAAEALKAEEPRKIGETAPGYMPFDDPLQVPPVAAQPVRGRKRAAKKMDKRGTRSVKQSMPKPKKSANRSMPGRSRKSAKAARGSTAKGRAPRGGRTRSAKGARRTRSR